MIQPETAATPAGARQALAMVRAGLAYLAAADPAQMPGEVQAECLHGLEEADAVGTAARAWILGAFATGQGYTAEADYSPRAWLIHKTRVTGARRPGISAGPGGRPRTRRW